MTSRSRYPALDTAPSPSGWTEELCKTLEDGFQAAQRAWSDAKIASNAIRYPDYTHLYKYRTVDRARPERNETNFRDGRIWAPSLDQFNDPLEAAFVVSASLSGTDIGKQLAG